MLLPMLLSHTAKPTTSIQNSTSEVEKDESTLHTKKPHDTYAQTQYQGVARSTLLREQSLTNVTCTNL